jgi:hypothetical protein
MPKYREDKPSLLLTLSSLKQRDIGQVWHLEKFTDNLRKN